VLPDVLTPGLRVVFCGSAAGTVSALRGAYYAGPGNRFWPTLHATGLTDRVLRSEEFRQVLDYGIGLTDLAKFASGPDATIRRADYDPQGLLARLAALQPKALAFNGKRAAALFLGQPGDRLRYGAQPPRPGMPLLFVLPSTSGLATRYWSLDPWRDLAAATRCWRGPG